MLPYFNTYMNEIAQSYADGLIKELTRMNLYKNLPSMVEKIVYNGPATIVFWKDGTKTVIKCHEGDQFDEVTGFLLCCLRKMMTQNSYSELCEVLDRVYATKAERIANEKKPCECEKVNTFHIRSRFDILEEEIAKLKKEVGID